MVIVSQNKQSAINFDNIVNLKICQCNEINSRTGEKIGSKFSIKYTGNNPNIKGELGKYSTAGRAQNVFTDLLCSIRGYYLYEMPLDQEQTEEEVI